MQPMAVRGAVDPEARPDAQQLQQQYRLALRYWSGTGAPKDEIMARSIMEKAAAAGSIDAKLFLEAQAAGAKTTGAQPAGKPESEVKKPQIRKQVRPDYPPKCRAASLEATVVVDFIVTTEGGTSEVKAAKSTILNPSTAKANAPATGSAELLRIIAEATQRERLLEFEGAAADAVRQWVFDPGLKDGKPVGTHMQVSVVFSLEDEKKK